jgi:hypothetical protein
MKPGLAQFILIVSALAAGAEAAAADDTSAVERFALPSAGEAASPGSVVGLDPSGVAELVPVDSPTGLSQKLATKPGRGSSVPEPATLAIFGVGLILLFRRRSAR